MYYSTEQIEDAKPVGTDAEQAEASRLGITVEKLIALKTYAARLHKKYPHKGKSWLQRKVCEHFKIKLT